MNKIKSLFVVLIICLCSAFSACGNPTKFDLDFIVDDEVYATITTAGNATIEMPEDPEKEGYTFDGWYWDKDVWENPFTANSLLDAPLSSDMKVYAKWTENHEHSYTEEIIAPTCTAQGYTLHTCSCGDNYKDTYTEKISHSMTEWVEITPASCNHLGLLKRYCEYNCGHIEYDDIDLLPHTEVIDEAVEPTFTQTGLTEGKHCSVCGETLIEQQIVPKKQIAVTSVDGGSINGNNLFILTGKDTTLLQLQNSLTITNNCEWFIYRDSNCTDIITSKVTDLLNNGDNTYYILLKTDNTVPTMIRKFYTLTIHRSYEVSINFYNGQTLLKTDKIYTGNTYNTDYVPDLDGYTFNGWVDSYNNPFKSHIIWESENYYVSKTKETYLVSFDKDGGTSLFDTMPVTFNESFNFGTASKDNYTFLGWEYNGTLITDANGTGLTTWNIDAEDIVVKARFEGHLYSVSFQTQLNEETSSNAGRVFGGGTFNYGSQQTISASTNLGYDFIGWYEDNELVSENESFNYTIPAKNVTLIAKWQTKDEMKNFTFSSTPTTCSIIFVTNSQLISLEIPEYITNIDSDAFMYCYNLVEVINLSSLSIVAGSNSYGYVAKHAKQVITDVKDSKLQTIEDHIFYVDGDNSYYVKYIGTSNDVILPTTEFKYSINSYVFDGYSKLANITLPNRITNISDYGFYNCTSIVNVNFEDNSELISIGNYAFYNCSNLTNITIPSSVTSIGNNAFKECSSLESVNFEDNSKLTSIGYQAFYNCSKLTNITIPNNVTTIGYQTFYNCSGLTSITIPFVGNTLNGISNTHFGCIFGASSYSKNSTYVPSSLKAVVVTGGNSISSYAFYNCTNLTSIDIPSGVTSIGNDTFDGCTSLTSITIPNSVTSIGSSAFYNCSNLTNITIPSGVTSIGSSAFYNCSNLTNITIPSGVTSISSNAFSGCSNLVSVNFEENSELTSIGSAVFSRCSNLTNITIPSGVTSIGSSAFYNCSNLTNITIPNNVTSIGDSVFYGCSKLTNITIPNNVTTIGYQTFYNCSGLTSITIPFVGNTLNGTSNTHFGYIFGSNNYSNNSTYVPSSLKAVVITGGNSISSYALYNCSSLTSITIPNSVTSIDNKAFSGCSSLTRVNYLGTIEQWVNISFECLSSNPLYNGAELYLDSQLVTELTIPSSVTIIGKYAFYGCSSLESVNFEDNSKLTSIGSYAFYNCSNLTNITIPNSVTSIGNNAFKECSSLESVNFEDNSELTNIGSYAFYNCSNLSNITIPNNVTIISGYGFYNCTSLVNVNFEENSELTSIGSSAFYNCSNLTNITIPSGVTIIGSSAFYNCSNLTNITIPSGVTSIGNDTFNGCTSLDSVNFEENSELTSIGEKAFYNCSNLTSVTIPSKVTSINYYAFSSCIRLVEIINLSSLDIVVGGYLFGGLTSYAKQVITDAKDSKLQTIEDHIFYVDGDNSYYVKYMGTSNDVILPTTEFRYGINENAFSGCTNLTSITISSSVTSIGYAAFLDCSNLSNITISNNVTIIGGSAFWGCDVLTTVYYTGSEDDWNKISIFDNSDSLTNATIVYNYNPNEE